MSDGEVYRTRDETQFVGAMIQCNGFLNPARIGNCNLGLQRYGGKFTGTVRVFVHHPLGFIDVI